MRISSILGLKRRIQKRWCFWWMQRRYRDHVIDAQGQLRRLKPGESPAEATAVDPFDPLENVRRLRQAVAADRRMWDRTNLSFHEQTSVRQKPIRFMRLQAEILRAIGGRVVVEIGSSRAPLRHPIHGFNPVCCNDGHSTHQWASHPNLEIHTVDISPESKRLLDQLGYSNLHAYTADGVGFLRSWSGPSIDLLFLDAWDVGTPQYAEQHLAAYAAARDKLSARHVIGIDDTDFECAGKGKLLVPHLRDLGYRLVVDGRQSVFVNFPLE